MRNALFKLIMITLLFSAELYSQEESVINITGKVIDGANLPLPGVNVSIKGTNNGTSTDIDGNYSISGKQGDILLFSFIGFNDQEQKIGVQTVYDIVLLENAEELGEFVLTALGFKEKRDKMSSTYSKIGAENVLQKGENKIIDGIAGKTSGVRISATSGDPGAGSNIQIRGQNTITGNSQPLIIVDGIPLNNDNIEGDGSDEDAGVSQQSRLNDINPDDIAEFQIFKGASAGALYGSRAMNGVIVITTKKGQKGKLNVSVTAGTSIDVINAKHPLQNKFGQGNGGAWRANQQRSWGDKISERIGGEDSVSGTGAHFIGGQTGKRYYSITSKNSKDEFVDSNFDKVFRNGVTNDYKINLSGGNDKSSFYVSAGTTRQDGIVRGSDYNKYNFSASLQQNVTDKFSVNGKVNFIRTKSNRIEQGSNTAGIYLGLLRNSPDFDISDYRGTYVSSSGVVVNDRHRSYRRSLGNTDNAIYNNPLWTINEQDGTNSVNRYIITAQAQYNWNDNISSILRGGIDNYTDNRGYFYPYYSAGSARRYGLLMDETIINSEFNFDFLNNFNYKIIDKLNSNIIVGFSLNDRNRKTDFIMADNFISNFRSPKDPTELSKKENTTSEIGRLIRRNYRFLVNAQFDYNEALFLTLGGSYEKHSSLVNGFFYPSVEAGWIFTKMIPQNNFFSFGKLRLGYGQVANAPLAHKEQTAIIVGSYSSFSDELTLEDFGGGYKISNILGNRNLRPEVKSEIEFGTDLRFLGDRLAFSFSYYSNTIKDNLLDLTLTQSLGQGEIYGNGASIENKGYEIETNYIILRKRDWKASVNANVSSNKNNVTHIEGGGILNLTPGSSVQSVAAEGHAVGTFYTQGALRDASGKMILDENGFPQVDTRGNLIVGDPNPDWRGGLGINLGYKNFSFSALFETSQGNDFSGRTKFITTFFGTHAESANEVKLSQDLLNYAGETITSGTTVRGNIEDFGAGPVLLDESYYTKLYGFGDGKLNEFAVVDGSWSRLREISVSYKLNSDAFKKLTRLQSVEFSIAGRNLALWTGVVGIDPDVNQFGNGLGQGLDYFTNPSTKSYLFSIKINY